MACIVCMYDSISLVILKPIVFKYHPNNDQWVYNGHVVGINVYYGELIIAIIRWLGLATSPWPANL